ncbi:MAG: ATP-dependent RNA ligase [Candidatus Methanohalarchaeum thermophilum]|uniref:ATP-dependent RNA ligase n=1 Tax=Methanohalarchaeum thermophilum TaxID=1903181 RepID=A0A1Q6DV22_METT1|nr:MAG: ATP-dependent RNA ligase [Candidatus Methanohalarchaeum thermophilum]
MQDKWANKIGKALDIEYKKVKEGIKKDIIEEKNNYFRFHKKWGGVERGTIFFKSGDILPGYPKIKRTLLLDPTLKNHFIERVAIEEKMNGYNVRIANVRDNVIAATRGGLICPYTTAKAREKINLDFFKENPHLIVCGEMVGPDNPYVPKDIYNVESLEFFVFDIRKKGTGEPLELNKRRKIVKEFDLRNVRLFGIYNLDKAVKESKKIIKSLGKEKREGIVFKDPKNNKEPIKYTSSQSNCEDLKYAYRFYNDYGSDFVHSRTVREAFQSYEWNEGQEELEKRAKRLGLSILDPMLKTIKEKKKNKQEIGEEVSIKVSDIDLAAEFKEHLKEQGVEAEFKSYEELEDNSYRIWIDKKQKSTDDKTKSLLDGGLW